PRDRWLRRRSRYAGRRANSAAPEAAEIIRPAAAKSCPIPICYTVRSTGPTGSIGGAPGLLDFGRGKNRATPRRTQQVPAKGFQRPAAKAACRRRTRRERVALNLASGRSPWSGASSRLAQQLCKLGHHAAIGHAFRRVAEIKPGPISLSHRLGGKALRLVLGFDDDGKDEVAVHRLLAFVRLLPFVEKETFLAPVGLT